MRNVLLLGIKALVQCLFTSSLLLLLSCASTRQFETTPTDGTALVQLRKSLAIILQDSTLYQSRTGVKVVSLDRDEVLFEKDSHLLFHPASNMKLLTTAAALSKLGPDFRFRTVVYTDTAAFRDSTIHSNVYLKGFGNPDLSLDDLRWLTQTLKDKGIAKISGDLICDDSYFDDLKWGAGWMWDDVSSWYYASIGALTVNDNCVTVTVKPAQQIGDTLSVQVKPNTSYMAIENFGVTVDSLDSVRIGQFKVERKWRPPENIVVIEGGRALESLEREYVIDVVNPTLYTGNLFAHTLQEEGIEFNGAILSGLLPDTSVVLTTHVSEPLTAAVININKISDNLSAEN
ncbi:D-alanyl-D-alanine carboxypeptidase/D-alanyl-D-alanine-endopeptidase, partial [bacterium]|nr:D-alanyl-D-alanine carboxypeptidase/D-alanyl-D-alanine-endopeptidase [bacterium]